MIHLQITPVEYSGDDPVWNVSHPLLIKHADVHFTRATGVGAADEPAKRKGVFGSW